MAQTRLNWLAPAVTIAVLTGPILAGIAGTVLPAFGYLPALGRAEFQAQAFSDLFQWPGFGAAVWLSLFTGVFATVLSLGCVVLIFAGWHGTRPFQIIERGLSPILAVPHAAAAFGLAFLIAPSGWVARAIAPIAGWDRPPDVLILQDPWGFSLVAGLVVKEVPFLLLMTLAALGQAQPAQSRQIARALGYGRISGWMKTVFPRVYPQIRLPIYAVLAFSMSVVDVAMILGPTTPPPLSVQVLKWMNDPDLTLRFRAAAAALVQLALVVGALTAWWTAERVVTWFGLRWIEKGGRGRCETELRAMAMVAVILTAATTVLGLAGLAVWSFAGLWRFPEVMPDVLTLRSWLRHGPVLWQPLVDTLVIAASAVAIGLGLTVWCQEAEQRHGLVPSNRALWLIYLPLILPQIAFLTGLQTLAVLSGIDGGRGAVIAVHIVFVLPYIMLSLSDPYRAWDKRYGTIACALGAGQNRVMWRVRLPMLLRPVLTAAAVGFAVSVGQYLPTQLIGAGRVQTITTEAVSLASGGDRRIVGIYALIQTMAAFLPFAAALIIPAVVYRNRKELRHG